MFPELRKSMTGSISNVIIFLKRSVKYKQNEDSNMLPKILFGSKLSIKMKIIRGVSEK